MITLNAFLCKALILASLPALGGGAALAESPEPSTEAGLTLMPAMGFPFKDNAVLQRDMPLPVWGTTLAGATVTVRFDGQTKTTTAAVDGRWKVWLAPMPAVKLKTVHDTVPGKTMTVTCGKGGQNRAAELKNLIMGDVWVAAGQSNMAGRMKRAGHPKNFPAGSIKSAHYPSLRNLRDEWEVCMPDTAVWMGRVAFFFARRVQEDALVPMGVIGRAVGGSNIESWLNHPSYPVGGHYKHLLQPVVGYGIRGALWYQGESNEQDRRGYQPKLEALITGWRRAWGQGDFPFHYVQLPGIDRSCRDHAAGGDGRAEIRQAFVEALRLKHTGLAVTIDIGTPGEHPPNKYDTGVRLGLSVLKKVYGVEGVTACPLYKGHKIEGDVVRIWFTDDARDGLMIARKADPGDLPGTFLPPEPTPDAKLPWLCIQDKDGQWHWADGKIDGAELLVSAKGVREPRAVRYAYTTQPYGPLLYNKDGLPVGPFSTIGYGPEQKMGDANEQK